jgi:hypothetical protein
MAKEEVKIETNGKQKAGNEQPLREQRELEKCWKHMEMRRVCLHQATLEPGPIEDLLVRNTVWSTWILLQVR